MAKFLVIYGLMDPATQLAIDFMTRFSAYVNGSVRAIQTKRLKKKDVDDCDVLVSVRTQNYYESNVIRYAKKQGKLCCLSLDDDFFSLPDFKIRRYLQYRSLLRSIETDDVILSGNDTLGRKAEALSKNGKYVRVETVVSEDEIYAGSDGESDGVIKIVYYVNDGSLNTYESILAPLMKCVHAKYGDRIQWHFIAIRPEIDEELKDVVFLYSHVDLKQFKYMLRHSGFTFGIAPLLDNEFCHSKYINKFIEYTTASLPCIYSNVEPYASFIQNGYSGLLTENTTEQWMECIEAFLDPACREQITQNAKAVLRQRMAGQAVFDNMLASYPPLGSYRAPLCHDSLRDRLYWYWLKLWSYCVMPTDIFIRIWGRLRCEGLGSLISYSCHVAVEQTAGLFRKLFGGHVHEE